MSDIELLLKNDSVEHTEFVFPAYDDTYVPFTVRIIGSRDDLAMISKPAIRHRDLSWNGGICLYEGYKPVTMIRERPDLYFSPAAYQSWSRLYYDDCVRHTIEAHVFRTHILPVFLFKHPHMKDTWRELHTFFRSHTMGKLRHRFTYQVVSKDDMHCVLQLDPSNNTQESEMKRWVTFTNDAQIEMRCTDSVHLKAFQKLVLEAATTFRTNDLDVVLARLPEYTV